MNDHSETSESKAETPNKPDNVLDSIFNKGGPMPPARFALRALALVLDSVLVAAIASIIIWKIAMPQFHPGAFGELTQWSEELVSWLENREPDTPMPEPSKQLMQALSLANELQLLTFWIYFASGEIFFAGYSIGKRICRIRSVSTITLGAPPILSGLVRAGVKTMTLLWLFPIAFAATFLALLFNKRRQLGHDLCARTVVVDEKFLDLKNN